MKDTITAKGRKKPICLGRGGGLEHIVSPQLLLSFLFFEMKGMMEVF